MTLNEKINWANLLIAFGISYAILTNYREYKTLKKIYTAVNSPESVPSGKDVILINKIKNEVLDNIEKSDLFNKFGKQFVLDSIRNTSFKIVDTIDFLGSEEGYMTLACFLDISKIKNQIKNHLLDVPSGDNFIIIQRSTMRKPNAASSITHEIYHYLDKLIGGNKNYSEKSKLSRFIDTRVDNKESAIRKLSIILFEEMPDAKKMPMLEYTYKDVTIDREYFSSDVEIFARYKTLKHDMVKQGVLSDSNEKLTINKISEFLSQCDPDEKLRNFRFIFYLDLGKLDELDKIL